MANITEILGTDSVSSSRPVINMNFELLNDEIASITSFLDPTTGILSGLISLSTQSLNISAGATQFLNVDSTGATFDVDVTCNAALVIDGKLVKSGTVGSTASATTNNAPTSIEAATYFIDSNFTIPAGQEGQEVTMINVGSTSNAIIAAAGASLGATSIALDGLNSTITLRCFNNKWFIMASNAATIA
jgi:hypothetical protein